MTSAELIASGRALGPVAGTLATTQASATGQGFIPFTIPLTAAGTVNAAYPISVEGDFCWISSITPAGSVVSVGPIGRGMVPVSAGKTLLEYKGGFSTMRIANANAFGVVVTLVIGSGKFTENAPGAATFADIAGLPVAVSAANPFPVVMGTGALVAVTAVEGTKLVAATAVPEALAATATLYSQIDIKALLTNTTDLFYGFTATNGTQMWRLQPGEWKSIRFPDGRGMSLASVFIDVLTGGEGVVFNAFA